MRLVLLPLPCILVRDAGNIAGAFWIPIFELGASVRTGLNQGLMRICAQSRFLAIGAIQSLTVGSIYQGSAKQVRDSVILDSGADQHNFNKLSRFTQYEPYSSPITALAGNSGMSILGKGTARIEVEAPDGPLIIYVRNAYYSPKFHTNVI